MATAPAYSSAPGTAAFAAYEVTPSDSVDLTNPCYGLYVGVTGNVKVTHWNGVAVTYTNVAVGWHPIAATRVWSTGTTASGIVAVH